MAKALAARLGYSYVDTGAMYRAITLLAMRNGLITPDGNVHVGALEALLPEAGISFCRMPDGSQHTLLKGEDVEQLIRRMDVSSNVSIISAIPSVRHCLTALQQKMGQERGVVMDGRDIGTTVFPDAELKIFMTADPRVRACRRYDELRAKGDPVSLEEIERNVRERDKADMGRAISPLRQAEDAIVLDNSCMTVGEQMAWFRKEFEQVTR